MRWIAPAGEPRIEWAVYVRGDAFEAGVYPVLMEGGVHIQDQFGGVWESMVGPRIPAGPLIAVMASAKRLDAPLLELAKAETGWLDAMCCEMGTGWARKAVLGLFDAQTGRRVAAVGTPADIDAVVDLVRSTTFHTQTVRATAAPVSPTSVPLTAAPPTASPVVASPTLTADNVPGPLRPVLSAYPLLPGSRWTWRATSAEGGVTWFVERMTETVRSAWLLDDRHAVVHSTRERVLAAGDPELGESAHDEDEIWRTVTADGGVYPYPADDEACGSDPIAQSESVAGTIGLPVEALVQPHNLVSWSCVFNGSPTPVRVSVPAGTFDDCRLVFTQGASSWASTRAVCRGVGYVETDSWHQSTWHGGYTVMRLESYDVVLPR